jgi:predicted acetyltransferase
VDAAGHLGESDFREGCVVADTLDDQLSFAAAIVATGLTLRLPSTDEEEEFLRAHRATSPQWPSFLHFYEEKMPFTRYLDVLAEAQRGEHLPPGRVPVTFLFAFVGPRIVGRVTIRHRLNEFLEREGGHIGYVVVPEFRRRGYATEILRAAVTIAWQRLGLRRVLITCDDDNTASIRTIEKNGGVLQDTILTRGNYKAIRRYWIQAGPAARL